MVTPARVNVYSRYGMVVKPRFLQLVFLKRAKTLKLALKLICQTYFNQNMVNL